MKFLAVRVSYDGAHSIIVLQTRCPLHDLSARSGHGSTWSSALSLVSRMNPARTVCFLNKFTNDLSAFWARFGFIVPPHRMKWAYCSGTFFFLLINCSLTNPWLHYSSSCPQSKSSLATIWNTKSRILFFKRRYYFSVTALQLTHYRWEIVLYSTRCSIWATLRLSLNQ